jgi:hypothetical protein
MDTQATIQATPPIPADWIAHSEAISAGNGYRARINAVLHKCDGYHPYAVHTAYEYNGSWSFDCGDYFFTLEEALPRFHERSK